MDDPTIPASPSLWPSPGGEWASSPSTATSYPAVPAGDMRGTLTGRQLDGHRVEVRPGIGGTVVVYRAYDAGLAREEALKVVASSTSSRRGAWGVETTSVEVSR